MKRETINSDYGMRLVSLPAHAFGRLQFQTGDELDALMPSVLDRAFKGEL